MGSNKFQDILIKEDIYLDIPTLNFIKDRFLGTYQRIPQYHQQGVMNSRMDTPNYSMLGHPYFSKYFNQMNNMANQASGTSEVAKMFFYLADDLGLLDSDTHEIAVQIHDSNLFYYYGEEQYIEHYAYAVALCAQKAWKVALEIGFINGTAKYHDIPMPVEVGMHTNWKESDTDEAIIVNLDGSHYQDNREAMDNWLVQFKDLHKNNKRRL